MMYYLPLTDAVTAKPDGWAIPLEDYPEDTSPNESFSSSVPGFQFVWDSVSSGHLKTCPRKYQLSIIEGWTFKTKPVKMAFGIAFHRCREVWFQLRVLHKVPAPDALRRVVRLAGLLGDRLPPGPNTHTKATLLRTVIWYFDHFREDPAQPITLDDGSPCVELDVRFPFAVVGGVQTYIVVHLDTLVDFRGEIYVSDAKTTGSTLNREFFNKFELDNQMGLYDVAANVWYQGPISGIIIDGLQIGVNFTRLSRHILDYHSSRREEFIEDFEAWLNIALFYNQNGFYPKNETACNQYGGCQFIPVCSAPPKYRDALLKTHFTQRKWDPMQPRD